MHTTLLDAYNKLCAEAINCQQQLKVTDKAQLESHLDALISQSHFVVNAHPSLYGVILNTTDKKLPFTASSLVKHTCFCQVLFAKAQIEPQQVNSLIKASLYLLGDILPQVELTKAEPKKASSLIKHISGSTKRVFNRATRLKLNDTLALKLLSQLAGSNTYSSSNGYIQSLLIMSLNTSLVASFGLTVKLSYRSGFNQLLVNASAFCFKQTFIQPYNKQLSQLITLFHQHQGSLIRLTNKNLAIIVEQNPVTSQYGVFECGQRSLASPSEYQEIDAEDINNTLDQQVIDQTSVIKWLSEQDVILQHQPPNKALSPVNRFSASSDWKTISRAFTTNNNKTLTKVLQQYPQQSKLVLDYASQNNRQKQAVHDVQHAIAMLGKQQLFPTLCIANIQVKQQQVSQIGRDVINYKVDLFCQLVGELHNITHIGLPKYHELVARILMIGLMTIPKVMFSASSPSPVVVPKTERLETLAQLFGLSTLGNWKKLSLMLAKSWLLPVKYNDIIEQYFVVLAKINNPQSTESLTVKSDHVVMLLIASYFYQHLLNGESHLVENQQLNDLVVKSRNINSKLAYLFDHIKSKVLIYTPLS